MMIHHQVAFLNLHLLPKGRKESNQPLIKLYRISDYGSSLTLTSIMWARSEIERSKRETKWLL